MVIIIMSYCVITVVPNRVPVSLLFNYMHYFSVTMQFNSCHLEINVSGETAP